MKLPSCVLLCFGSRSSDYADSSTFSVTKGPGPSTTVCSGLLGSFLGRRSGSRGSWDVNSADTKKPSSLRARHEEGQDVVTIATARYLELFAGSAKHDESASSSDVKGTHDSLRSVRTASEHCGSRASRSSAVTGRTSREVSRLGSCSYAGQHSTSASVSSPLRSPAAQARGFGINGSQRQPRPFETNSAPQPDGAELAQQQGPEHQHTLRQPSGALNGAPALVPQRHIGDRSSPSVAALLLPTTPAQRISRAYTALPFFRADASSLDSEPSVTQAPHSAGIAPAPVSGSAGVPEVHSAASARREQSALGRVSNVSSRHSAHRSGGAGGLQGPFARRSRMCAGPGATAPSADNAAAGLSGVAASGLSGSCAVARPQGSATSGHGSAGGRGFRRSSIHFSPDGDVTVTGLPPTILSVGRVPRCLAAGRDSGVVSGSYASPCLSLAGDCIGTRAGSCARPSFDIYCTGANYGPAAAAPAVIPAVFLASQSVDSVPYAAGAGASSCDVALTLNDAAGVTFRSGSATAGGRRDALPGSSAASRTPAPQSLDNPQPPPAAVQAHHAQPHGEQQQRRNSLVFPGLSAANAAYGSPRINWGASMLYPPSAHHSNLLATRTAGSCCTGCSHTPDTTHDPAEQSCSGKAVREATAPDAPLFPVSNTLPPPTSGDFRGEYDSTRLAEHPGDTCGSDAFAGFSGQLADYRMLGSSLLATEAQDVTSALSRLQEACMTAVTGELRSQRLAKRGSTECLVGRWPLLAQGTPGSSVGQLASAAGASTAGSSALLRMERSGATTSGGAGGGVRGAAAATAPSHRRSLSNARSGATTAGPPSLFASSVTVTVAGFAAPEPGSTGEPQRLSTEPSDIDRPSAMDDTIVMDGQMLEGMRLEQAGEPPMPRASTGVNEEDRDTPDSVTEYRTRLLNVLLRGDFFVPDSQSDDGGPASEDDDEGVVEYRYGGFELGGDSGDCGFERRASFVEAVRRCSAIGAGPVGVTRTSRFKTIAVVPSAGDKAGPRLST